MDNILLAGFDGQNNSAKVLLDRLSTKPNIDKLYLQNDYKKCASQIIKHIKTNKYKLIIAFGQKPAAKSIFIERYADTNGRNYKTIFQYELLKSLFSEKGYAVKISDNAGNYLCNHVYGAGLSYLEQQKLFMPYLFIHIPTLKNLTNINMLAVVIDEYIDRIACR